MRTTEQRIRRLFSFFVLILFASVSYAQNARVSGRVLDSQQALIRAAEIALLNVDTASEVRTVSNTEGNFLLPPVPPGRYEVRASSTGFAISRLTGITLEVGESRVVTLELRPATVQETVMVSDTAPELSTDRADRSVVIARSFVESIPLNVRNPLQLINFSVAVTKGNGGLSGMNITSQSRTNTFRINGAKGSTNEILIDGAANNTAYYNQAAGIPGVDTVQEYRVYTDPYAPEIGRTSGGAVTYSLRSGNNDVHGSLFEFLRNSAMDANGFNANKAGQAIPSFRRNQFGATLSGPVWLPRLYNGRNRTFFFVSYEGLRDSNAGSFTGTMPTDLERRGDFSRSFDANGNLLVIYDPSTTRPDPAAPVGTTRYVRTPFPGDVIPADRINPIGTNILKYYPAPNQPGIGKSNTNNFFSNAPGTNDNNRIDARFDHQFSSNHTIFGHFSFFNNWIYSSDYYGNGLTPVNSHDRIPGFNVAGNHTWSIRPNLLVEHHLSWAHSESNRAEPVHVTPAQLGFPASIAPGLTAEMTPNVSINRISSFGNNYAFEANKSSVWQYRADSSWLKRNHTIKFGIDMRRYPVQLYNPLQMSVSAASSFTGGPNPTVPAVASGHGVAELLLGQAAVTSGYQIQTNSAHGYYGFYAQDVARLTSNLTVTFGLRWGYESGDIEDQDRLNYIDLDSASPLGTVQGVGTLRGGVGIPGLNGTSRHLQQSAMQNFDPRIGIAYSLGSRTVIRSGFGIFHHPLAAWEQFPNALGSNRVSTSIIAQPDGVTHLYNLSNPFPQGLPAPYGNNAGLAIAYGQNITGPLHQQEIPYQTRWTFDIQRELPAKFVVTTGYVGNSGTHLMSPIQYNQLPDSALALGSKLLSVVPNPFYGVIQDSSSTLSASTVQYGQLIRPYPQFMNVRGINVGAGHSSYHAGQLTVERRYAAGLSMLLGYAFSKAIDNVGEMTSVAGTRNGFQNNYCYVCDRSRSDQNQTHTLRLSARYELPFGHGHTMLNRGLASHILGGWVMGGFWTLDSGRPVMITSPNNSNSLGGGSGMRAMATGEPAALPGGPQIKDGGLYFNTAAFYRTPVYAYGNVSRYLPNVDLPTNWNVDALIEKNFALTERWRLTFRGELFNPFNNAIFAGPTTDVSNVNFGKIAALSQTNSPRQIQVGLRLGF